jgi:hypothetical protein
MQPGSIDTRVEAVTLYHRGATVRRTATLDFSSGVPRELHIADLPLSLLDHTVRVRIEAEGGEVVLSSTRVGLAAPLRGAPPLPVNEQALREVRDALELTQVRTTQLRWELEQLGELPVQPRPQVEAGRMPSPSPMAARAALEQLTEQSIEARVSQLRALVTEGKRLAEREADLVRRQQLASSAMQVRPDELRKSVHAVLNPGATAKRATLVLEYFVQGARWAPAYQCRMTRDCTQADLQLRAVVCQRTGEDWRGVTLSLSTASPMSWSELPELSAIRLGRAQPPPPGKRAFRPPPQGGAWLFSDFDRGLAQARAAVPVNPSWQPPALMLAPSAARPRRGEVEAAPSDPHMDSDDGVRREEVAELREEVAALRVARPSKRMAPAAPAALLRPRAAASSGVPAGGALALPFEVPQYTGLRLEFASNVARRGRLSPVDRRQVLFESLAALGLGASFDVLALVEAAEAQGAQVHMLAPPPGTADVRAEAGWYDYVYTTDAAVDVPSDGTFHSVPVNTRTASGEVLYVVVPREDPHVYRQASVRNPLRAPLLPGPCEVYVAGEYVLTTTLPSVAPGGNFKLSLGVEQAIKVARNTKYREQRSGDKVVATNELIHDLEIELVNNLDRDARCEVRERLPRPAPDAEVVVEEGKGSPPWEPYQQQERGSPVEGGRRWLVQVPAGAMQKLAVQYRVKLYANNELVGGNRREA